MCRVEWRFVQLGSLKDVFLAIIGGQLVPRAGIRLRDLNGYGAFIFIHEGRMNGLVNMAMESGRSRGLIAVDEKQRLIM